MSEIVSKIKYAMSLRTPQEEALSYLDAISSHCDYKKDSKDVVETAASEYCEKQRKVKAGFDFPSFCFAMATGIGKTRLMGACIYHLYKTKAISTSSFLRPEIQFMISCARSPIRIIRSTSSKDLKRKWADRRCMTVKITIPIP